MNSSGIPELDILEVAENIGNIIVDPRYVLDPEFDALLHGEEHILTTLDLL